MTSHLKKLQIMQNIKKTFIPSHLHIFWLKFDKENYSFLYPFLLLEKKGFWKNAAWGTISNFLLPRFDEKNLGKSFEWVRAWVKMLQKNAFSRYVNSINFKMFPTLNMKIWAKIQQAFWREAKPPDSL